MRDTNLEIMLFLLQLALNKFRLCDATFGCWIWQKYAEVTCDDSSLFHQILIIKYPGLFAFRVVQYMNSYKLRILRIFVVYLNNPIKIPIFYIYETVERINVN